MANADETQKQHASAYKYIQQNFEQQYKQRSSVLKERIIQWRADPPINAIERPTNIARARELGYKAKQGVIIVRVRVRKGNSKRDKPRGGRKPSKNGRFFAVEKSMQSIGEERASRKFINCEVLNSYYVGEDGEFKFYENILLDRDHGAIKNDPQFKGIISQRGRAFRGLTMSGRKHRGIIK